MISTKNLQLKNRGHSRSKRSKSRRSRKRLRRSKSSEENGGNGGKVGTSPVMQLRYVVKWCNMDIYIYMSHIIYNM